MNADGVIARDEPSLHQRTQQANRTGRIATGIGDPARVCNFFSLPRRHLRKPVSPVRLCTVRGACVDDANRRIDNRGHSLARGGIRQAEDGDVAGVDGFRASLQILALRGSKRDQSDIGPVTQPFVDEQPSGALVAVDENNRRAHG